MRERGKGSACMILSRFQRRRKRAGLTRPGPDSPTLSDQRLNDLPMGVRQCLSRARLRETMYFGHKITAYAHAQCVSLGLKKVQAHIIFSTQDSGLHSSE